MHRRRTIPFHAWLVPLVATTATVAGSLIAGPASAAPAAAVPTSTAPQEQAGTRTVPMPDGGSITVATDGTATRTTAQGKVLSTKTLLIPHGSSGLGAFAAPGDDDVRAAFAQSAYQKAPSDVLAVLSDTTTVTGAPVAGKQALGTRAAITTNPGVNAAFAKVGAASVQPLFPNLPAAEATRLTASARGRLGPTAPDLSKIVLVHLKSDNADAAAKILSTTPGVTSAEPNRLVTTMSTRPTPLPPWVTQDAARAAKGAQPGTQASAAPAAGLPTNFGLTSSLQSFLNAGGTNAMGAYSLLQNRFGQLPGTGEVITNVSVGDLTDQSMADAGDSYVRFYGPTTIVQGGQRYLDLPSMPLIPTYTADPSGTLDPVGATKDQDPVLGEVLLDFGVMAPLPHNAQRPSAVGSGATDLLGIAPGAQYRLVVPQQPTFDQIAAALLAAARQNPQPNVITASLGYGTDAVGFPSRYLEDDPILQAVIASIVQQYHIVVTISANDGTRLFTPAAVGPDGGSTATDVTRDPASATNIADDQNSTIPSLVLDSGAIAVGGTTLDDTLAVPPQSGGQLSHNPTFATTRTDGGGNFSSGFGSRVNVSAPSDGIAVYEHETGGAAQEVQPVLNGGTSASAPMTAAAAAIVLQTARLTGKSMSPDDVRSLLERTGRAVATPPQIDQPLNVGPQIDVTAAVSAVLGAASTPPSTSIARLSVAHRETIGGLGGSFTEYTEPGRIDLTGPDQAGEGLVGPVTIGADVVGLPPGAHPDYVLRIGGHEFHADVPAIRLTPTEMLRAAGLPVVSAEDRTIQVTFEVRLGQQVLAATHQPLTFGPTDGTYVEALAPVAPPTVKAGSAVKVHYDITGVRNVVAPQLAVSTVGHWNPALAPNFTAAYTVPLTGPSGDVTLPASAFDDGGGIYGIGVIQQSSHSLGVDHSVFGEFTTIRVDGATARQRPAAPTLAASGSTQFGHDLEMRRATPGFSLRYDVRGVPGATGAALEISAPAAPTLYGSLNTVSNPNGTVRDHDGVDSGSVVYQRLPGSYGNAQLDAAKLGLGGSLHYNVRVFPLDGNGKVVGQASATSMLTIDDGLAPDDGLVASFAILPASTSAVAIFDPHGGESLREYDASAGTYGRVFATDSSSAGGYQIIGIDPGAHRLVVLHWSTIATPSLQTYDTVTTQLVNDVSTGNQYTVLGGRVDRVRHRAVILGHRTGDNADIVLPLALATGTVGAPIDADTADVLAGGYKVLALSQTTGLVYLSRANIVDNAPQCFGGGEGTLISLNLDSGAVVPASGNICVTGLDVDEDTNSVYETSFRRVSLRLPASANLSGFAGATMDALDPVVVRQGQQAIGLAVDAVHHLALVPFVAPTAQTDNNATSQIDVVDLTTGETVSTISALNFRSFWGGEFNQPNNQPIQLDPTTRTAWTISGDGRQIQQFQY